MNSSEERREVAESLREYGNDTLKDGSLLKTLKDVTGPGSWRDVLLDLADLIEPEEGYLRRSENHPASAVGSAKKIRTEQ